MLKHLSYSVTFPSTGRTLAADVAFRPGVGVITGPNESGKSEILEVIRFCLFGSAALRGKAEDYKSLRAELQFAIRGDDYSVVRTGTSARLDVEPEAEDLQELLVHRPHADGDLLLAAEG